MKSEPSEVAKNKPQPSKAPPPPPPPPGSNPSIIGSPRYAPTWLDKIYLRWSGQFKAGTPIPPVLDGDTIFKARSYGRIRVNIGFLFIAALGSGLMMYLGKQAAARGESVEQINLDWHRSNKEAYLKEQAASQENKKA